MIYFSDIDGRNNYSGKEESRPVRTLERALERAQEGDTVVNLDSGQKYVKKGDELHELSHILNRTVDIPESQKDVERVITEQDDSEDNQDDFNAILDARDDSEEPLTYESSDGIIGDDEESSDFNFDRSLDSDVIVEGEGHSLGFDSFSTSADVEIDWQYDDSDEKVENKGIPRPNHKIGAISSWDDNIGMTAEPGKAPRRRR